MNPFKLFSHWRPGATKQDYLGFAGGGLVALALLLLAMGQVASFGYGVEEVKLTPSFGSFHRFEQLKDGQGNLLYYSWTRPASSKTDAPPVSTLRLTKVTREELLVLTLEMSLARPADVPPAQVEINLLDDQDKLISQLAIYNFDPNQPGFNKYRLTVPPSPGKEGLTVQIKSDPFTVKGEGRELGVRFKGYTLEQPGSRWRPYLWPQPYLPAALLLLLGVGVWAWRTGVGWLELVLLLGPLAFVAGAQSQYLRPYSGWALLCAALVVTSAGLWQSKISFLKFWRGPLTEIGPLLLGVAATISFFLNGFAFSADLWYYHNWVRDLYTYGPLNIYNNSPLLDYPPLAPYVLYPYSWFAHFFGLIGNSPILKGYVSLMVLAMVYLLWQFARQQEVESRTHRATLRAEQEVESFEPSAFSPQPSFLVLFGFNIAVLYNPAVWGQLDVGPTLLLLLAYTLIYTGRPYWGAIALGGALIFKPQAIFALPLIGLLLLKKAGWWRGWRATGLAVVVSLLAVAPAFGFSWDSFSKNYWTRGELAGENTDPFFFRAYNFPYLLDYNENRQTLVVLLGFGSITLIYLVLAWLTWFTRQGSEAQHSSLAVGLAVLVCFAFAIKMHERYIYYALPFLALATFYDRRMSKSWLIISLLSLVQLLISPLPTRFNQIPDSFYLWQRLVQAHWTWLPDAVAWATLAAIGVTLLFYLWRFRFKESLAQETNKPAASPELATSQHLNL